MKRKSSLVDSSSSSSQAVRVRVFWGSDFGGRPEGGGGRILSKSSLLVLVSPTLPTIALKGVTTIYPQIRFRFSQGLAQADMT